MIVAKMNVESTAIQSKMFVKRPAAGFLKQNGLFASTSPLPTIMLIITL